jgi:hypothetical protein
VTRNRFLRFGCYCHAFASLRLTSRVTVFLRFRNGFFFCVLAARGCSPELSRSRCWSVQQWTHWQACQLLPRVRKPSTHVTRDRFFGARGGGMFMEYGIWNKKCRWKSFHPRTGVPRSRNLSRNFFSNPGLLRTRNSSSAFLSFKLSSMFPCLHLPVIFKFSESRVNHHAQSKQMSRLFRVCSYRIVSKPAERDL